MASATLPAAAAATAAAATVSAPHTHALAPPVAAPKPNALHKPRFHVAPLKGWSNDPNGIHYDPKTKLYHMFYQYYPSGSMWRWGLHWGHAVSRDLLMWHHLGSALEPTADSPDQDGVWSGCAFPTEQGTVILNTAVKLRANSTPEELPPAHLDLGLQMVESQAFALAQPTTDPLLRSWTKGCEPLLPHPPAGNLTGWRDPFLVGRPDDGEHDQWTMVIGAGYTGGPGPQASAAADPAPSSSSSGAVSGPTPTPSAIPGLGTALVYKSDSPTSGWQYAGELCRAPDSKTGSMWECPLLARLPGRATSATTAAAVTPATATTAASPSCSSSSASSSSGSARGSSSNSHVFVLCPDNAHHAPVYYTGPYCPRTSTFDLASSGHPHPLDLGGATFYAPNLLTNDPQGRLVMWGWCQELGRPRSDSHEYGCCLSLPRLLWRNPSDPSRLFQEPLPALQQLRAPGGPAWRADRLTLAPNRPQPLPHGLGATQHLEIKVTFHPPARLISGRVAKSGLLLRQHPGGEAPKGEACGRNGAALLFDWRTGRLDLVYGDGTLPLSALATLPAQAYKEMNSVSQVYVAGHPPGPPRPEDLLPGSPASSYSSSPSSSCCASPAHPSPSGHTASTPAHTSHTSVEVHHLHHSVDSDDESDAGSEAGGDSDGEADVERRGMDVRGCHAVGGRLTGHPATSAAGPHNHHNHHGHASSSSSHASRHGDAMPLQQPLTLTIFLDHSLLEVFTSTGDVLTARVYRDYAPAAEGSSAHAHGAPSIQLASFGCRSEVSGVEVHEVQSCWEGEEALALLESALKTQMAAESAAAVAAEPAAESAGAEVPAVGKAAAVAAAAAEGAVAEPVAASAASAAAASAAAAPVTPAEEDGWVMVSPAKPQEGKKKLVVDLCAVSTSSMPLAPPATHSSVDALAAAVAAASAAAAAAALVPPASPLRTSPPSPLRPPASPLRCAVEAAVGHQAEQGEAARDEQLVVLGVGVAGAEKGAVRVVA